MSVLCSSHRLSIAVALSFVFFLPNGAQAQEGIIVIDKQEDPIVVEGQDVANMVFPEVKASVDAGEDEGSQVISAPSVVDPGANNFFDAEDLVPQGEMADSAPRKLDPVMQPASKFIIIKRTHEANDKVAQLISAERALTLGRFDSAVLMFDGLYEGNKKDSRILMGRAVSLQKLGRFDEAMQMYEALSKVDPKNLESKVNMLGLLSTRYPAIALQRLLALHDSNKSNAGLVAQIAIAYAKTGDTRFALHYLGMAASMEPDNANHILNMAVVSDRAGNDGQAISYYEQALELDIVHGAGRSIPRDVVYERLAQIR